MKQKETVPFSEIRDILLSEAEDENTKEQIRKAYSDENLRIAEQSFKDVLMPVMIKLSKE